MRRWEAAGRPLAGLPFPATRFAHEFPVAAVFGLRQGRLFLADRLLRALSPEELDGVVAHEAAHHAARDNLKRVLLEASPDLLALTGAGARLRRAFEDAAEAAADARACARVSPLVLARTLLKVASLVPPGQRLDAAVAALHRDGSLSARVQALVAAHDRLSAGRTPRARASRTASPWPSRAPPWPRSSSGPASCPSAPCTANWRPWFTCSRRGPVPQGCRSFPPMAVRSLERPSITTAPP